MTGFATGLGAPDYSTVIRDTIIYAADHQIGANTPYQKVFFTESWGHTFTQYPLGSTKSLNVSLGDWIRGMINDGPWENIRPDLEGQVTPWMPFNQPPGIPKPNYPFTLY